MDEELHQELDALKSSVCQIQEKLLNEWLGKIFKDRLKVKKQQATENIKHDLGKYWKMLYTVRCTVFVHIYIYLIEMLDRFGHLIYSLERVKDLEDEIVNLREEVSKFDQGEVD